MMEKASREYFLDHLKVALTILVILHHLAIVFGGSGGFVINVSSKNIVVSLLLTLFLAINQSYFMGLFFGISGYFSEKSLKKKGTRQFIKGKVRRLLIPAIIYFFIIGPSIQLVVGYYYKGVPFQKLSYHPQFGAIWFIFALGIFDILYSMLRSKTRIIKGGMNKRKIIFLLLIVGHITFLVRVISPVGFFIFGMQLAHFPQYIMAYLIGTVLSRRMVVIPQSKEEVKARFSQVIGLIIIFLAGVVALVAMTGDISPAFGGLNIVSYFYSLWDQFMFFATSLFLLYFFKSYLNSKRKFTPILVQNAYGAYLVHSAVIASVVILLSNLKWSGLALAIPTCILSLVLSFLLPYLYRALLGMR